MNFMILYDCIVGLLLAIHFYIIFYLIHFAIRLLHDNIQQSRIIKDMKIAEKKCQIYGTKMTRYQNLINKLKYSMIFGFISIFLPFALILIFGYVNVIKPYPVIASILFVICCNLCRSIACVDQAIKDFNK